MACKHYVCDSCGRVYPAELLVTVIDETNEKWDICPICNGTEEDCGQYNYMGGN